MSGKASPHRRIDIPGWRMSRAKGRDRERSQSSPGASVMTYSQCRALKGTSGRGLERWGLNGLLGSFSVSSWGFT